MEWYWIVVIAVLALAVGFVLGMRWAQRASDAEIESLTNDLGSSRLRAETAEAKIGDIEPRLATLSADLEARTAEAESATQQVGPLTTSNAALKQSAADATTARKAAEAALVAAEGDRDRALTQAGAAKKSAAEASEKFEGVTAEFVAIKRTIRETEVARQAAESARDAASAEAVNAAAQAASAVAGAEQSTRALVEEAHRERDAAVREAEESRQRRIDGDTLRKEVMAAQREAADLRDELAERDRTIRQLQSAGVMGAPTPVVAAELETVADAPAESTPVASTDIEADVWTVDDLPGGDWEPDDDDTAVEAEDGGEQMPGATDEGERSSTAALADVVEPDADKLPEEFPEPSDSGENKPEPTDRLLEPAPVVDSEVPSPVEADDLRKVKGIGPKFEGLLHARDVTTYEQIMAIEDDDEWETYLDTFSGRIVREEWRQQAQALHAEKYGT